MVKKRKEREVIGPQEGPQEDAFFCDSQVIIYGGSAGSGKSHLLMMRALRYIHDPEFEGVYFRRTTANLRGGGGLFSESKKMYAPFKPNVQGQEMRFTFPSGAKIKLNHLQHEDDAEKDHQG